MLDISTLTIPPVVAKGWRKTLIFTVVEGREHLSFQFDPIYRDPKSLGNLYALSGARSVDDCLSSRKVGTVGIDRRTFQPDTKMDRQMTQKRWDLIQKSSGFLQWALPLIAEGLTPASQGVDDWYILPATWCQRCGRVLTHPESIGRRIGPECLKQHERGEHLRDEKWWDNERSDAPDSAVDGSNEQRSGLATRRNMHEGDES